MNSKSAIVYHLLGLSFCLCATYFSLKIDIDAREWFGILGVYLIEKGDYYELKEG